jgi:hypothetical protein
VKQPWTIEKCEPDWDWYVLKDADGHHLGDASIEGDAEEWSHIALGLLAKHSVGFKRCALDVEGDTYKFCSPRNTMGRYAQFSGNALAVDLATEIVRVLDASKVAP